MRKINLVEKGRLIDDFWSPKIIAELNNQQVKLAKFQGEFGWHFHKNEDELFFVVEGQIEIHLRDQVIVLHPGECLVVPKGVEHNPISEKPSLVMLFEPDTTLNTGNIKNDKTQTTLTRL